MPLSLATLQSEERSFDFPFAGESVHITYRPGRITPDSDALTYAAWLELVVVSWDLVGLDGAPHPLDQEHLKQLPDSFLSAVTRGVLVNARLDPTTSGTSGDG